MPSATILPIRDRWAARWDQTREWLGLGLAFVPVGERLFAAYSAPGRHYHDARHVLSCLDELERFPGNLADHDAAELALWFQDAVYDVRAAPGANEAESARFYRREFADLAGRLIDHGRVEEHILATRHASPPPTRDAAAVVDIDLCTLGAPPVRYDAYAEGIRAEYAHVAEDDYRRGRAAVLRGFLGKKWIYHTRHYRQLLEKPARDNLARELHSLDEGLPCHFP